MVEANVDVEEARGELILELVEAGKQFHGDDRPGERPGRARRRRLGRICAGGGTALKHAGTYRVAFSNVDDQLRLWVDGTLVEFDATTEYGADEVWGSRQEIIPQTSESDPGDLAPAAIGARGAKLVVTRLQLWRDIYYVADSSQRMPSLRGWTTSLPISMHPFDRALLSCRAIRRCGNGFGSAIMSSSRSPRISFS